MDTAIILLVAVVVLGLIALVLHLAKRRRSPQETDFKTTAELMMHLAAEAVADAAKKNDISLDYTIESIERVEIVLSKLHDQYITANASLSVDGLAMAYGAYIGEVIRRTELGSTWERDHSVAGERSYPIHWGGGESFPCAWCFKRITNGPEDNVWHKYLVLKNQRMATPPERLPDQ